MSSAGGLLDVLKQKMQQSKDELEKYKEESENMARNYQEESRRREDAENEVASLNRKITLLEEDLERSEERFNLANGKLSSATQAAEESERLVNSLKNKMDQDDGKL